VLIFQPTVDSSASDKQSELCLKPYYCLRELCNCYVLTYKSGFSEGFRRWGGPFWLQEETSTFMGPATCQNTAVLWTGMNKIPQNFHTLFVTSL